MKTLPFLSLLAVTGALLSSPVHADDHSRGNWHGRHHDWHSHSRTSIGIGIGIAPRPYYYDRPAYYYERPPTVVVERPVYRTETVYVGRSASSGSSLEVEVQRGLARAGYYRGPIDGDIGPRTRSAIRDFQSDHGMEPTGRISRGLVSALR